MTFCIVFYKSNMVNPTFLMLNITFWGLNVKGRDIQTITGRLTVMADTNLDYYETSLLHGMFTV